MITSKESTLVFEAWKDHLDNPLRVSLASKTVQGVINSGELISEKYMRRDSIIPPYADFSYDCAVLAFFRIEKKGWDAARDLFNDYESHVACNTRRYSAKLLAQGKPLSIHAAFLRILDPVDENTFICRFAGQTQIPENGSGWKRIEDEYWEPSDEVKMELIKKGRRYAFSLMNNTRKEVAETIAFNAYIKLEEVETIPKNMEAYYITIVENLVKKYWKTKISLEPFCDIIYDSSGNAPVLNCDKNYIQTILESAINKLPELYQRCIFMKYLLGHSSKEIASELAISVSNVNVHLFRARERLKEILESNHEFMHNYSDCIPSILR